jgi:hypothetical protein
MGEMERVGRRGGRDKTDDEKTFQPEPFRSRGALCVFFIPRGAIFVKRLSQDFVKKKRICLKRAPPKTGRRTRRQLIRKEKGKIFRRGNLFLV